MARSTTVRLGSLLCVLALGAGCATQPGSLPASPAVPPASAARPARPAASWTAEGLKSQTLLYVSNANGTVNVYRYWQHTLAGVLTDFSTPQGQCSDQAGHVYITDSGRKRVYEYAHGGKKPINSLDTSPYLPYGCAVSPSNGDLAIANAGKDEYTAGEIAIYPHGSGTPTTYAGPYDDHFINCAYDDHGDLFTNSEEIWYYSYFYNIAFYYLPKHGSKLIAEDLSQPYFSSGWPYVFAIMYDGKYWAVDSDGEIYLYAINIGPQYEGDITFPRSSYLGAAALYRKTLQGRATQLVGSASSRSASAVDFWKYPTGGPSIGTITKDLDAPVGLTISLGQHG